MDILEAIQQRHSVRKYLDKKIEPEIRQDLDALAVECNAESGLNISIHYDDPSGFNAKLVHYGSFKTVSNYIVLAGKACKDFDEKCGYYGEKIVIRAQQLGLNTCWTALTYNKRMVKNLVEDGEVLCMVIALGYGENQGNPHKSKPMDKVLATKGNMPDWFRAGAEAAMLAPTAVNQQKFKMGIIQGKPAIHATRKSKLALVDLGIVKYHFEVASGHKVI